MNLLNQLMAVGRNLAALGPARLAAMGGVAVLTIAVVLGAAIYLNKPTMETLYVGLETTDANQISIALAEAGIPFETSADGTSVQVAVGKTAQARLLLAERGLPNSTTSGYELFDKVGSLGLTSFMQEVTRVRALEGEIARTILAIDGITAARVHIVLPDAGSFRRGAQKPTASIMIRAGTNTGRRSAASIRHLVAASVPGLSPDDVTVLDSTGQLLASGEEYGNSGASRSLSTEQQVQKDIESNIDKALAPFLGMDNFRASVVAKLNTDAQQIQETIYDPESRVERSVRVTKEEQKSQSTEANAATTVEQNVPQAPTGGAGGAGGPTSADQAEKKEELTNYEINSKTIATTRNTYSVEKISVAVVVNKARLLKLIGENADQAAIDAYVEEMKKIVQTAAAINADRGDQVEIQVMDFLESEILDQQAAASGFSDMMNRYLGTIINALAFIAVAFLIVWFGFRPLARSMGGGALAPAGGATLPGLDGESDSLGLELPDFAPAAVGGPGGQLMEGFGADFGFDSTDDILGVGDDEQTDFNRKVKQGPERRLSKMVEISEERAAKILRKWAVDRAA
ncbi:flagellar basal-body MS-ring/collar protein FliF [Rhizobium sp. L1K21]|uniref:flagellar basal-body MS-ring/collar protein FliF n=1 Tax=Rhizobium sp. L1K21 TaxID=2954933 RepID=UPI00209212BF|nr:flagellar basal-body MS-ring/collar protein FliF [Rhizobium sp. L1K21]MCO6187140.1 flagellar M-ring protein FliF [Rhizobium sp. L1K21]